jgi:hypothetical protein
MSTVDPAASSGSSSVLLGYIPGLLIRPAQTWTEIRALVDRGKMRPTVLFVSFVLILAAVTPLAKLVGNPATYWPQTLAPFGLLGHNGLTQLLLNFVQSIAGYFVMAYTLDMFAKRFGGTPGRAQAFALSAFAGSAYWLAGIFYAVPGLSWLGIVGVYSLWLLYTGAGPMMGIPREKTPKYLLVVLLVSLLVQLLLTVLVAGVFSAGGVVGNAANLAHDVGKGL